MQNHVELKNLLATAKSGLIVITGKTGSGKSVLALEIAEALATAERKISIVSTVVERRIVSDNVLQLTTSNLAVGDLSPLLRTNPDVIVIDINFWRNQSLKAIELAQSGLLVIVVVHAYEIGDLFDALSEVDPVVLKGIVVTDLSVTNGVFHNETEVLVPAPINHHSFCDLVSEKLAELAIRTRPDRVRMDQLGGDRIENPIAVINTLQKQIEYLETALRNQKAYDHLHLRDTVHEVLLGLRAQAIIPLYLGKENRSEALYHFGINLDAPLDIHRRRSPSHAPLDAG